MEVLPKSQWIQNYKEVPIDTCLDDDVENKAPDEEEQKLTEKQLTLMQQINSSQSQVTARVVGVIKKMVKTYGGSILSRDMMLDSTREKLALFAKTF